MTAGCDNSLDAFEEENDLGGFSIFGFLDFSKDVNFIRIKDVGAPLLADSNATIDADVTLHNVDTGDSEQLEDSVVVFENIATHNFRTTMDITPATAYRLTVEGPGGNTRVAEAVTPADAEITISPESGYTCSTVIRIIFDPVRSDELVQAEFLFSFRGADITVPAEVQQNNGVARIVFEPRDVVARGIGNAFSCESVLGGLALEYTHIGSGFEEILNDFEGLGTEQFVGLIQGDLSFSINRAQEKGSKKNPAFTNPN